MTIQQHASFDSSAAELNATSKLVKAWESKNAKNAAKAGGISLMALSLAACGGSSSTTTTATTSTEDAAAAVAAQAAAEAEAAAATAAQAAAEAAAAAAQAELDAVQNPTPVSSALTDGQDILTGTASSDTFTATADTLTATDVISDTSTSDNDTLTVTLAEGENSVAPVSISGVENVTYNVTSFADVTVEAANIVGATITVNNLQLAGTTGADVDDVTATTNVTLGDGVTGTATVDLGAGATGTVNVGSATDVTITAGDADDTITAVLNGDVTLALATAETAVLSATETSDVTFDIGAATSVTADANITLNDALVDLTAATITGAAGVAGLIEDGETSDLTGVDGAITVAAGSLDTAAGDDAVINVADGASVSILATGDGSVLTLTAADDEDADTETEQTVTASLDADYDGTITLGTSATDDDITTLNLAINVDQTATLIDVSAISNDGSLVVTGTGDAVFTITNGGGDLTVNAAAATGALTGLATDTDVLSITTGSGADGVEVAADDSVVSTGAGDDTITLTSGDDFAVTAGGGDDQIDYVDGTGTVDGGEGTDEFSTAGAEDLSGVTLSNIEVLDFGGAGDFNASQLHNATYIVLDASDIEVNAAGSMDVSSLDLSGLTFETATDSVTVDLSAFDAADFLSTQDFTFIGSAAADTVTGSDNDDTISGGAGADNITGGTGADTIDVTETTDVADTLVFVTGDSTEAGADVVTGFAIANDILDFDAAAADHLADLAATSVADDTTEADDTVTIAVTDGVMTAAGADAANLDTLAEWVDASETVATAIGNAAGADLDGSIAFEFGGDTHVLDYTWTDATTTLALDNMVTLSDVTGITDLDTAAAANTVVIA